MAKLVRWTLLSLLLLGTALLLCAYRYFSSREAQLLQVLARGFEIEVQRSTTDCGPPLKKVQTDVIPHRVYVDTRPGSLRLPGLFYRYSNATVIFISVHRDYRQAIIGCEIDGLQINKTKRLFLVLLDAEINERSTVSMLYLKNTTVIKEPVRSDSVVIPPKNATEEDEVIVCATGFGVVPYLDQWLIYQKSLGIKIIHLNVEPSFLKNLDKSSTLKSLISSGFVKISVWKDYLNSSQVFYYSQSLKYQDCALRYQGIYKYMMVIDFDEFFVPYKTNKTVLYYAKMLIRGNIGSVVLPRLEYNKSADIEKVLLPSDGNMTRLYDTSSNHMQEDGKSIHLTKSIKQNSVHVANSVSPYRALYMWSPQSAGCYVAHLTGKIKQKNNT